MEGVFTGIERAALPKRVACSHFGDDRTWCRRAIISCSHEGGVDVGSQSYGNHLQLEKELRGCHRKGHRSRGQDTQERRGRAVSECDRTCTLLEFRPALTFFLAP